MDANVVGVTSEKKQLGKQKQLLGLALGVAISLGILGYFLWSMDWGKFLDNLSRVEVIYIPFFALTFVATYLIRTWRWKYLLPNSAEMENGNLFDAFSLGALGMFLLPFRAGELIRAFTLRRWQGVPFSVGFASIITERAFDVLSLLIIFALCLLQIEDAPEEVISAAYVLAVFTFVILLTMLLCYFVAEQMLSLFAGTLRVVFAGRALSLQEKLVEFARGIIEGFRAIKSYRELGLVLFSSLLLWLVFGLLSQIGLWCFGEHPSIWVGMTTNVIIALAIAIPSAPGFLGVYQLGCFLALSGMFGYSKEFSFAYAVLSHSLQFLLVVLIGFWSLQRRGLKLAQLRQSQPSSTAE